MGKNTADDRYRQFDTTIITKPETHNDFRGGKSPPLLLINWDIVVITDS